jgi:hypothetical protein
MTGPEAIDTLPGSVRIGSLDYAIEIVRDSWAEGCPWGECDYSTLTIRVKRDQPSSVFACDTVMHEFMHAIYRERIEDEAGEERIVTAMSQGWTGLFRDNPWLPGWVAVAVRDPSIS